MRPPFFFDFTNNDREVRERLLDTAGATTATSMEPLHDDRLADIGFRHDQCIDIQVVVVFRVGDCRFQRLLDRAGNPLGREFEIGKRCRDLLAADQRGNQVELLRADTDRAQYGARFVISKPARSFGLAHDYFLFAFLSAP